MNSKNKNIISEKGLHILFVIVLAFYLFSFFIPAFGMLSDGFLGYSENGETEVIYGYQCFFYSFTLPFAAISQGDFYNFFCTLLGCFANLCFIGLWADILLRKPKSQPFIRDFILVLISILSVLYWSFWETGMSDNDLKSGYYLWAVSVVLLNVICILWLRIRYFNQIMFKSK
jgi:hypothetical protein